jgi:hypothetical protein
MRFKLWLESQRDIFGFDDGPPATVSPPADDRPVRRFNINSMMEDLASRQMGTHAGFQKFPNEVQWGTEAGAIKIEIGMQHTAYLERLVHDREGSPVWLTKRVYMINTDGYMDHPGAVAEALYGDAAKLYRTGLDGPAEDYSADALEDMVMHLVARAKETAHQYFIYEGVKRVNPHNYIVRFAARGGGVGALFSTQPQGRINEFIIDVSFCRQSGLLHTILTSVQTTDEGVSWEIQPSLFEGWFAPAQGSHEVAEALLTSMKYF